jgi:hypothetical protein
MLTHSPPSVRRVQACYVLELCGKIDKAKETNKFIPIEVKNSKITKKYKSANNLSKNKCIILGYEISLIL